MLRYYRLPLLSRRCYYGCQSNAGTMSTYDNCGPENRPEEHPSPRSRNVDNASKAKLWNPSTGIKFTGSSRSGVWNSSQQIAFSTAASCLVRHPVGEGCYTRKQFPSMALFADSRSRIQHSVPNRHVSSGALFPQDLPIDSVNDDYGLGQVFEDDEIRRPTVRKKLKAVTHPSESNRKGSPLPTAATKRANNSERNSAQLASSIVKSKQQQLLSKHTRLVDPGRKPESRASPKSGASRASTKGIMSRNDHVGETGLPSAQYSGDNSTVSKISLEEETAAFARIVRNAAKYPQTVEHVAKQAIVGEVASYENPALERQKDENNGFLLSEATTTSTKRYNVHMHSSDTSRSAPGESVAESGMKPACQALLQREHSACWVGPKTSITKHDRSFSEVERLVPDPIDQYSRLREIFLPSDRGWTAIKISLEEASQYATSRKALSRLELIFYEIMVLTMEYKSRTHDFRRLLFFRLDLDQYSLLSAAKKYMLLRDIREYVTHALLNQCREGYEVLKYKFLQFRCLREQRLKFIRTLRIPRWEIIAVYPSPFLKQLTLSAQESYHLFLFVNHCPVDKCSYTAAINLRNVNRGLIGIRQSFKDVRVLWTTFWIRSGYSMTRSSLMFKRLMESEVMQPKFLVGGLRDYEEIVIRLSNHDHLAVLEQNRAVVPTVELTSKKTGHLRLNQEFQTASCTSLASLSSARDGEIALRLASKKPFATTISLENCMYVHRYLATNTDIGDGSSNVVAPPPLEFKPSQRHASSQGSGQIILPHGGEQIASDAIDLSSKSEDSNDDQSHHIPLSYQIPERKLKEAMLASRSTASAYWKYSLYQNRIGERVKVHYCKSKETTERIVQLFLDKKVIGFDIEWKPNAQYSDGIRKNVSLIQLASEERIALFHIAIFSQGDTLADLLAPTLKLILEDPKISKVGVSIKSDCTRLQRSMGIKARGIFELSHLYKLIKYSASDVKKIDKKPVALARQVEEHLQLPLWKGDVRMSDWSLPLNYEQTQYAASDSYAGLQLYDVMEGKRKALESAPPRPEHAELDLPIRLGTGQIVITDDEPEASIETASTTDIPLPGTQEMARDFL